MTFFNALMATRRRRLRPEAYSSGLSTLLLILLIAVGVRMASNLYISAFLAGSIFGPGAAKLEHTAMAAFFLNFNCSWMAFFLATVSPLFSYRSILRSATASRAAYLPISHTKRVSSILIAAIRGFPSYIPLAFFVSAWLIAPAPIRSDGAAQGLILLFFGLASGMGLVAVAWSFRVKEEHLEFIQLISIAACLFANPDPSLSDGAARITLFSSIALTRNSPFPLFLLPLSGAIFLALLCAAMGAINRFPRKVVSGRYPLLSLYWRDIPAAGFLTLFFIELFLIFYHASTRTSVKNILIFTFIFRCLWFAAFAVRAENAIANVFGPIQTRSRHRIYSRAVTAHAALSVLPLLAYFIKRFLLT